MPVSLPGANPVQIYDVAVEGNGVFWLATSGGLLRHAPLSWRRPADTEAGAGTDNPVFAVLEDRAGGLWFATASGLLAYREGRWRALGWPETPPGPDPAPVALYALPNGQIALTCSPRTWQFDPASERFTPVTHAAGRVVKTFLGQFKDGSLCAQTHPPDAADDYQLESYDGHTFRLFLAPDPAWSLGTALTFVCVAENGDAWIGSREGLGRWNETTRTFERMAGPFAGPADGWLEVSQGKIWCSREDAIVQYDGKTWTLVRSGLGRIHHLRQGRDGSVWVATERGVHRLAEGAWISHGTEEGLPSMAVWDISPDRRGWVWAATQRGLSLYHRTADLDPPQTTLTTDNAPVEFSTREKALLTFRARDKWDYTPPGRLLYSWRLDGNPWSPFTSQMQVILTNLAAGEHRFAVRAMDRHWNEEAEPATLEFTAVVPWYAETRLLLVGWLGILVAGLLAWLAVNRHLRLRRSYAEVERIVAQRTHQLEQANRELLHSQKMRALGTLAAGIAHDFNSILSIIKGSAQIIEANLDDPDRVRTRVSRIQTMVEQGAGLVKTMLGFSRHAETETATCDVNQLIQDTRRLLSEGLPPGITLRFEPAADLPHPRGAPDLIRQILLNLLFNAADALGGQGEIRLRAERYQALPADLVLAPAPAPQYVAIHVQDAGQGIAPEILPRIFEPFFTTKALSTRHGTGLGLTMVYEIAKELGFGLQVESAVGQGTVFTLLLPVPP
jgi:signal transduction histidine kinase